MGVPVDCTYLGTVDYRKVLPPWGYTFLAELTSRGTLLHYYVRPYVLGMATE